MRGVEWTSSSVERGERFSESRKGFEREWGLGSLGEWKVLLELREMRKVD